MAENSVSIDIVATGAEEVIGKIDRLREKLNDLVGRFGPRVVDLRALRREHQDELMLAGAPPPAAGVCWLR